MKIVIALSIAMLTACVCQQPLRAGPHGVPPIDSHGVQAQWCDALVVTDYGTEPPTKIIEPGGWCWPDPNAASWASG